MAKHEVVEVEVPIHFKSKDKQWFRLLTQVGGEARFSLGAYTTVGAAEAAQQRLEDRDK